MCGAAFVALALATGSAQAQAASGINIAPQSLDTALNELGAQSMATGWHLHQSLRHITTGAPLFAGSEDSPDMLSSEGMGYLGGLLEHAAPASAFTTPTVNGPRPNASLAPDTMSPPAGHNCRSATRAAA